MPSEDDADIPATADDDSPERLRLPEPEEPALPGRRPAGVTAHGTTVSEQLEGESLDEKIAREEPENRGLAGDEPGSGLNDREDMDELPGDEDALDDENLDRDTEVEAESYEDLGDLPDN